MGNYCAFGTVDAVPDEQSAPIQNVSDVQKNSIVKREKFRTLYRLTDTLGSGSYSVVKKGYNRHTNEKVAVKILCRTDLSPEDDAALRQEVAILRSLDHKNIIKCYDFFVEDNYYYVVLEYMDGGEVFERLVKKSVYYEKEARDVVKAVLSAIEYCHQNNIVHRDLKPENLLLKSKFDDADLKIADFGFASVNQELMKTQLGTPGYIAPEILEKKPYGKECDMWSIGVIAFILLGGYPPFHASDTRSLFKKIRTGKFTFHPKLWQNVSEEAKDFISGLLEVDTEKRMKAEDCYKHPWLRLQDDQLSFHSLENVIPTLRKFCARSRFRTAVLTVMAIRRMQELVAGSTPTSSNSTTPKSELGEFDYVISEIDAEQFNDDASKIRTSDVTLELSTDAPNAVIGMLQDSNPMEGHLELHSE